MASVTIQQEQKNVVVNAATNTVFFQDQALCYNYKTGQWSRLSSASGKRFFGVNNSARLLGTIENTGLSVMVQDSSTALSASAVTATVVTGDFELNPGGRALVDGVRPLTDGASLASVRIGVKSLLSDTINWSTGTSINSRTGMSNFRAGDNVAEGRYHRSEFVFTGGFTTVSGADFEFSAEGGV